MKKENSFKSISISTNLPLFFYEVDLNSNACKMASQAIQEEITSIKPTNETNLKNYYTTSYLIHKTNYKFNFIIDTVSAFCKEILINTFDLKDFKINCFNCWGAVYKENDYAVEHNHFPSTLSAVVYLEVEKNASGIFFDKSYIEVKPGLVLIFPGLLLHSVPKTKGVRTIVAMNFDITLQ